VFLFTYEVTCSILVPILNHKIAGSNKEEFLAKHIGVAALFQMIKIGY